MGSDVKTREMILRLKDYKAENNLSDASIFRKVQARGFNLSESSVRRVFEPGSEDKSFRYEDTIQPIVIALLETDKPTQEAAGDLESEAEALRQLVQLKNAIIDENKAEAQKKDRLSQRADCLKGQAAGCKGSTACLPCPRHAGTLANYRASQFSGGFSEESSFYLSFYYGSSRAAGYDRFFY